MSRDWRFYLDDMLACCRRVQLFSDGLCKTDFLENRMAYDATVRNLELIGEAARNIPAEVRENMPEVPWREMVAFRNLLIHGYFGINDDILWDVIKNEIPTLSQRLQAYGKTL